MSFKVPRVTERLTVHTVPILLVNRASKAVEKQMYQVIAYINDRRSNATTRYLETNLTDYSNELSNVDAEYLTISSFMKEAGHQIEDMLIE